MDLSWHLIWKCACMVVAGIILLRLSGRRSISQMNVATTIVMISIGEFLSEGIIENTIGRAIVAMGLFLATLILLEWMGLKSKLLQKWISGKVIFVIRNGEIDLQQLKNMRMTYDQLDMRLRQKGISHLSDVQTATIEMNGELGYELKRQAQPLTIGEMEKLLSQLNLLPPTEAPAPSTNLFVDKQ